MKLLAKIETIIWISIFSVFVYLILPLVLKFIFPSYGKIISILCILIINSIYVFITSMLLVKKYGFSCLYPITLSIVYILCAFLIYKTTTLSYSLLYLVLGLVGSLIYFKYSKKIES